MPLVSSPTTRRHHDEEGHKRLWRDGVRCPGGHGSRLRTGNAIEVRNLAKSYKEVPVLQDVSFTVRQGTVFALLGANGSGKTTTINILTTLLKADDGTASVAGFDVAAQSAEVRGAYQRDWTVRSR